MLMAGARAVHLAGCRDTSTSAGGPLVTACCEVCMESVSRDSRCVRALVVVVVEGMQCCRLPQACLPACSARHGMHAWWRERVCEEEADAGFLPTGARTTVIRAGLRRVGLPVPKTEWWQYRPAARPARVLLARVTARTPFPAAARRPRGSRAVGVRAGRGSAPCSFVESWAAGCVRYFSFSGELAHPFSPPQQH
jgi:hypothetical protein